MTGYQYVINQMVMGQSAVDRALATLRQMDGAAGHLRQNLNGAGAAADDLGRRGRGAFDGMGSSIRNWVAGLAIGATVLGSLQTTAQAQSLEKSIIFASGSAQEGAKNLNYVRETADQLGLSLQPSMEGFKTLAGSLMGTGLTAAQSRDIFHGVASAAGAMGMSADDSKGAFIALGQMASKGKVQAEELRGQLGERLSGAFYQAAASMGVSTKQFDKMLETGKVFAGDFLPKFATQLEKTFGAEALKNTDSATANFNRLQTGLYDLKILLGEQLMPSVIYLIKEGFIPMVRFVKDNKEAILAMGGALGGSLLVIKLWGIYTTLAAVPTLTFTSAVTALNLAFLANPVFWLVAGFVALVTAVVYAWNKFEGFRATMFGTFEVIREFGKIFLNSLLLPFKMWGKILLGVFTLDLSMIKSGLLEPINFVQNDVMKAGDRLGSAFQKGYQNGLQNFQDDKGINQKKYYETEIGREMHKQMPFATAAAPSKGFTFGAFGGAGIANDVLNKPPTAPGGGDKTGKGDKSKSGLSGMSSMSSTRIINIQTVKSADKIEVRQLPNGKLDLSQVDSDLLKLLTQVLNSGNQTQPSAG